VSSPTLAARATSLTEILGSGGETFSLDNPSELSSLLSKVATQPAFRVELASRAQKRGADFSWDKTAAETAEIYRQLVREGRS
jgi:glycosyltransferase involved in cell wall biosynthesis